MNPLLHVDDAARRKAHLGPEWVVFHWQAVGTTSSRDSMLTLAVPRPLTRGPRKGRNAFPKPHVEVFVSESEARSEYERFERETGKCGECSGRGKEIAGVSVADGTRYRPCSRCLSTGMAPCAAAAGGGS